MLNSKFVLCFVSCSIMLQVVQLKQYFCLLCFKNYDIKIYKVTRVNSDYEK